ncbi:hypothetical protein [Planctomycetes bacterium TBK1r]|uniref:hypothetical protein n=1 Tax=Stieleria magnilauensis TaxID=2527963 RepID=UPI00119D0FCB
MTGKSGRIVEGLDSMPATGEMDQVSSFPARHFLVNNFLVAPFPDSHFSASDFSAISVVAGHELPGSEQSP